MSDNRKSGRRPLCTAIDGRLRDRLDHYAKKQGETLRAIIERALIREMSSPPQPNLLKTFLAEG